MERTIWQRHMQAHLDCGDRPTCAAVGTRFATLCLAHSDAPPDWLPPPDLG
jgi:hypothetical protein